MRCRFFSGRLRLRVTVFAILASPAFGLSAQEPLSAKPEPPVVTTMSGMRSLVPTLVVTGWMDFFLDLRQPMGLTDEQTRQLSLIRQSYLAFLQQKGAKLSRAELNLYQDMASDVVTSEKLGKDLRAIAELKTSIAEAHFTAVLEAINVLNHRQHLGANEWMKLELERTWRHESAGSTMDRITTKCAKRHSWNFHWQSAFTPQQLLREARP